VNGFRLITELICWMHDIWMLFLTMWKLTCQALRHDMDDGSLYRVIIYTKQKLEEAKE